MENDNKKSNIIVHVILIIGAFAMVLPFCG